jgi:hypothetical protein
MQKFKLRITKKSRITVGILLFSVILPFLLTPGLRELLPNYGFLLPMFIFTLVIIFIYQFAIGKVILTLSNDRIEIEWIKRFLFDNQRIGPINISDIKAIIIDNDEFLRKIITNDSVVEINNIKPVTNEFKLFVKKLREKVRGNNGRVLNSDQFATENGFKDSSFYIFIVSLSISIFLISRLWALISFYSLLLLLLPMFGYINHVRQRVKKIKFLMSHDLNKIEKDKIYLFLSDLKLLDGKIPNNFHNIFISTFTNGLFDINTALDRKVLNDFKLNIKVTTKYFDKLINSNFTHSDVTKFANSLIDKVNSEHRVYLINVMIPNYWYFLVEKLYADSKNYLDNKRLEMLEELIDLITDLKRYVNDEKIGITCGYKTLRR